MKFTRTALMAWVGWHCGCAGGVIPGPQEFRQEVPFRFVESGLPDGAPQLLDCAPDGRVLVFAAGRWHERAGERWQPVDAGEPGESGIQVLNGRSQWVKLDMPSRDIRSLARAGELVVVAGGTRMLRLHGPVPEDLAWGERGRIRQVTASRDGSIYAASDRGLFRHSNGAWTKVSAADQTGRDWTAGEVLGVAFDAVGHLWIATTAGAGRREGNKWTFYEGKDGLPWNEFTCIAAGPRGEVWFGTRLGVIRRDAHGWHYRQGPRWLAADDVRQVLVDGGGKAWFSTSAGVCGIERLTMTLAEKAEAYEGEIERYVKRTPYGFVAEAALRKAGDRSSADPQDSDNDGLWTAMYGAGECFAYGATREGRFKERARKAFEALRFLQKVTQGGTPAPPPGYIARTIRPADWPDPNAGRLARDQEEQKSDRLWKAYEPRWPKSADGKWYWKSDTSSDELDGHYFFYPLFYEFCADSDAERERVRDVVRGITDHLIAHDFNLVDHDGKPTRWGVYGPEALNRDADWWQERGLKSLSMLSYLAGAAYVTGDAKYERASRELIEKHGYAQNAMHSKIQHGPGSGNQSDDEMAFMCFYNLLRYSKDEELKGLIRISFFRHWVNEEPELNPFFNFAYAAQALSAKGNTPWGEFPLAPWEGWHEDSMATLYGFPLDRLNWPHRNSHRLDLVRLSRAKASDITEPDRGAGRGHRVNGKVLPVENRHFGHWNTDPWRLDYGGAAEELAAGTVYLLPYYMGMYHGFIEKPPARTATSR